MMLIKEAYQAIQHHLQSLYGARESSQIAEMVMESITGYSRTQRLIHHDASFTDNQEILFDQYLSELQNGRPVQYVLGGSWFQNMFFKVNESVLIPRPETEELVELILHEIKQTVSTLDQSCKLIDIGTGSGCIAISIKKAVPFCEVWAIDKSSHALNVAKENAEALVADIIFRQTDILSESKNDSLPAFNFIVSNPPYILPKEANELSSNVIEHEPKEALFVTNNDPLEFYKAIIDFSAHHLLRGGLVFFETHEKYAHDVKNLLESNDFEHVKLIKDLQGKDRIVWAKRTGASL
jgi:release factor glutamine methyltransferase